MKALRVFLAALLVFGCFAFLFSCAKENKFGVFDDDGITLMQNAQDPITADAAKALILENAQAHGQDVSGSIAPEMPGDAPMPTEVLVSSITTNFSSCTVTTTYYNKDGEATQSKFLQSTELKDMLKNNEFLPVAELVVKYALIFPDAISYMEAQNEAFRQSEGYDLAPVKELFSFYTNRDGNLVLQIKNFEKMNISDGMAGGVNGIYRQDVEIVYDEYNKISSWQASMGMVIVMPDGEVAQGSVMKVDFEWKEKN